MQGQGGQHPAMRGDMPPPVQRAQALQQRPRLGHRPRRRWRQKGQVHPAPQRQFQRQPGKVRHLDLGRREIRHPALLPLRPQPVAHPFGHPPRPPAPLICLGLGHPLRHQPRHARVRVEPRPPRPARVNHHPDIRQGQRGFGDGCRQHHLAPRHRCQSRALGGKVHRAVKRAQRHAGQPRQHPLHPPDLPFPRQKDQNPAFGFFHCRPHRARHHRLQPQAGIRWARQPARFHRKGPALRGDDRRIPHQRGHRSRLQRRRHHQKHQLRPQRPAHLQTQGQPQIGVQAAFVKFVKDHQPDARQFRVGLDHSGQDALGHHLDPGGRRHLRLAPDAVADRPAHGFPQGLGHPFSRGTGRQPPRLQHQDAARDQPPRQEVQRHAGRLARAGRGLQHGHPAHRKGGGKVGKDRGDGQRVGHPAVMAAPRAHGQRGNRFRPSPSPRASGRKGQTEGQDADKGPCRTDPIR